MQQFDPCLPDELSELIYKDVLGLLNEKKKLRLDELLKMNNLSETDRALIAGRLNQNPEFDYKPACTDFMTRIHVPRSYLRQISIVAAVIVLLLSVGIVFYHQHVKSLSVLQMAVESELIQPGISRAMITLGSGEKIELNQQLKELSEKDGTRLSMATGQLVYQSTDDKKELIYNTVEIPRGGEYSLILSDGTRVWLNAQSELKYPVHFIGDKREVFLKGEAYFEVTRNEYKPFIVNTSRGNIRVLGTVFNIRDYKDEMRVTTTLINGSVNYTSYGKSGKSVPLQPGYQLEDTDQGISAPKKVCTALYTGWKDGKYLFENASLEEIMQTLERWYDVTVFWRNPAVKHLHFTGDLERYENINTFLKLMETGGDVKFEIKGKTIIAREK